MAEFGAGRFTVGATYRASISSSDVNFDLTQTNKVTGSSTGVQFKFYKSGFGHHSFYIALGAAAMSLNTEMLKLGTTYTGKATGTEYGGHMGFQWFWGHFTLGVGGGGYSNNVGTVTVEDTIGNKQTFDVSKGLTGSSLELVLALVF